MKLIVPTFDSTMPGRLDIGGRVYFPVATSTAPGHPVAFVVTDEDFEALRFTWSDVMAGLHTSANQATSDPDTPVLAVDLNALFEDDLIRSGRRRANPHVLDESDFVPAFAHDVLAFLEANGLLSAGQKVEVWPERERITWINDGWVDQWGREYVVGA